MAVLNNQDVVLAGLAEALVAASAGGDSFHNNGQCMLVVDNGSAGSITVTIDDPNTPNPGNASQFNPDVAVAIPAGQRRYIGPFPPFRFNNPEGYVNVTYSAAASVTVGVVRLRS